MLIFYVSTLHLWGRTLAKYPQDRALAYADDGYIKAKVRVTLQVLVDLKCVLERMLDFTSTSQRHPSSSPKVSLSRLRLIKLKTSPWTNPHSRLRSVGMFHWLSFTRQVSLTSMSGTDAFVQNFVAKKCREIIDDVEKLDATPDGFIHYQLLRFCQATRLQYLNDNNFKITDSLLTKGTKQHADGWDASSKAWSHMVLHLPHAEGGFGVTFNDINKDSVFYTSNSRFVT